MFDLVAFILSIRPDLQRLYPQDRPAGRDAFLHWLLTNGMLEYAAVAEDAALRARLQARGHGPQGRLTRLQALVRTLRPDVRKAHPALPDFLRWFHTHGVQELPLWRWLDEAERAAVLAQPEPWATRARQRQQQLSPPPPATPLRKRPAGVNVIGYAYGQLGIGEDARMAARALHAAGVPAVLVDFPPGSDIPQQDRSMAAHVSLQGKYAVNLFCLTAEETGRCYVERGAAQFRDHYNIGYWPWELGKWPQAWEQVLDLVDEVWVSTQHIYDALQPVCDKPLQLMPMAVELGELRSFASRKAARRHFGLPEQAQLFCFSFDLNSWVKRKNPQACLEAFLQAFPAKRYGAQQVGLVIKVGKPPKRRSPLWQRLKQVAATDPRIHVIEQTLPRAELLALYQCCDCFLSLHRAEGFGRNLAEALQLGLHVICTGYSGNVDFCLPPHADLVRYRLVKVGRRDYVHTQEQYWAEPDVAHAARLLRAWVEQPQRRRRRQWAQFAPEVVGQRYRERLQQVMGSLREDAYYAQLPRSMAR